MEKKIQTIGVLGGSGALGSGLSYRLGKAGYQVVIGSRTPGKASEKVNEINLRLKQEKISIESNYLAAEKSELVILAVPFSNHRVIVEEIATVVQNKIVLDTTVPLVPHLKLPEFNFQNMVRLPKKLRNCWVMKFALFLRFKMLQQYI